MKTTCLRIQVHLGTCNKKETLTLTIHTHRFITVGAIGSVTNTPVKCVPDVSHTQQGQYLAPAQGVASQLLITLEL